MPSLKSTNPIRDGFRTITPYLFEQNASQLMEFISVKESRLSSQILGSKLEPDAVDDAIGCTKHRSRSHDAVIRVYDEAGNVIETHEHKGRFKDW